MRITSYALLAALVLAASPSIAQTVTCAASDTACRVQHNDAAVLHGDLQAILQQLKTAPSATAGASASTSSGSASTAAPAASADALTAKFFPTDPGAAAFPSPENSRIVRLGSAISGRPYLIDSSGTIHQLIQPDAGHPNGYTVNGNRTGGGGSEELYSVLIERQGKVFAQRSTGQWQAYNSAMGSMYNASLPDAFQTDASGTTTSTVATSSATAPTLPAPMSPAPGSSGKILTVGPGKQFATITAAVQAYSAGDEIDIDAGVYRETPPALTKTFKLKGVGGSFTIDATGLTSSLAYGKGALVPTADGIIENAIIKNVAMDQVGAQLTSGIRPDVGAGYLTLNNVELVDNQSGLGTGGNLTIKIVVNGGHFHHNGLNAGVDGNGYTHNIYTGAGTSLTLNNLVSDDPNGGHAVKHRGWETIINGGSFSATDAASIDLPQGSVGVAIIDGATITKPAGSNNHAVVDYASENTDSGNGGLVIKNSIMSLLCDNPFFNVGSGSKITLDPSTKLTGTKPTAQGGKVAGL